MIAVVVVNYLHTVVRVLESLSYLDAVPYDQAPRTIPRTPK